MTTAERLREAARTLRDDIREPYDAPLADWLDAEALLSDIRDRQGIAVALMRRNYLALAVADAVLGGEAVMSACISRHGECDEHTPDAEWVCTLCGDVDTAGLRAEEKRLRAGIEAISSVSWDVVHPSWVKRMCDGLLNPTEGETDEPA